jgi:hypothetical protein
MGAMVAAGAATCAVAVTFDLLLATDDLTDTEALALLAICSFAILVLDLLDFVLESESIVAARSNLLISATLTFCVG